VHERSLDDLIGDLDAVVWEATATPDLRFTYVSPAAERILGHPVRCWLEEPGFWEAHIHPDDREVAVELCAKAVARHEHHVFEYRWLRGDGEVIRICDAVHVLPGSVLRGVMMDVTERHETEERLRLLLDNAQDCVYRIRLHPRLAFEYVSPGCEPITGRPPADFYADPWLPFELAHPDDRHVLEGAMAGEEGPDLFRYVRDDGSEAWVETRRRFEYDGDGRHVAIEGFARDVTDRVRAQALFEAAYQQAPVGMAITALGPPGGDRLVEVNEALCAFLGRSREALLAGRLDDFTHPDDRGSADRERRFVLPDGREVWGALRATLVRDPEGRPLHGLAHVEDVSDRRAFEHELAHRALHDPLTGLPNRALFLDRLAGALAVRPRHADHSVAVLYVDVDELKAVNDARGHAAGDALLRDVAHRLRDALRPGDTVARIAGDEFTVLCADIPGDGDAAALADRLVAAARGPAEAEHVPTVSVGIATRRPGPSASPDELLADADLALMYAKRLGGGHVQVFDERLRRSAVARRHTESELRRAHQRGELRLHYQPIVDLRSGEPLGVEALVRWEHPERGLLPPGEFVPLAERTGAIVELGRWVIEQCCRDLSSGGLVRSVSINLSARQLVDARLPETVEAALSSCGLEASALCFEVTETALVEDPARAAAALAALRRLGARVAIDDFGTGYSSLAQLKTLPVDVIKVDRLFVQGLADDARDLAVVAAIIRMAGALGLDLVAEGIETEAQRERLAALGCEHGQGFLFARPMPLEALHGLAAGA
jgi:diguanylate cyclase (GGDEF)-like protein/PAS domain S-box-containing protein